MEMLKQTQCGKGCSDVWNCCVLLRIYKEILENEPVTFAFCRDREFPSHWLELFKRHESGYGSSDTWNQTMVVLLRGALLLDKPLPSPPENVSHVDHLEDNNNSELLELTAVYSQEEEDDMMSIENWSDVDVTAVFEDDDDTTCVQ